MLRFGTVGSPKSTPTGGTPAAVQTIRNLGMNALEIAWVQSVRVKDETCELIRSTAANLDVRLSVHAPYYINLNSQTDELMVKSDARLLAAARKGFLAGATDIIFHPGSYHNQPPEEVYARAKKKLIEIVAILRGEGNTVQLRPETMGKGAMFGSLEETVQLSKEIDGIAPCIDIAHLHARTGNGAFNSYEEFTDMFRLVEKELGRERGLHQMHFHISGIEYSAKGERNHVPLQESDLHWQDFLRACVDFGVKGTIVAESPNIEEDAGLLQSTYLAMMG